MSGEADDIANLAFTGGRTNRNISDKPPAQYFPALSEKGPAAFDAQCIPIDPALLEVKCYKEFLTERRQMIAARLNEFLGTQPAAPAFEVCAAGVDSARPGRVCRLHRGLHVL